MTGLGELVDSKFATLKAGRRSDPLGALEMIGELSAYSLRQLARFPRSNIAWLGSGTKNYVVYSFRGEDSRGVNTALFEEDAAAFQVLWNLFVGAVEASRLKKRLKVISAKDANRAVYTALMAFSALMDITRRNNGQPGVYLEMIIGPTIAILSGRSETGAIKVPIQGTALHDTVTVDLSFASEAPNSESDGHWLVLPTKMSTRERISQAYVHHRILSSANIGDVDTVLCAANETNKLRGGLTETLVYKTIALYERYIANLFALVYLDPPVRYLEGLPGMPPVTFLGDFLTSGSAASLSGVLR